MVTQPDPPAHVPNRRPAEDSPPDTTEESRPKPKRDPELASLLAKNSALTAERDMKKREHDRRLQALKETQGNNEELRRGVTDLEQIISGLDDNIESLNREIAKRREALYHQ